MIKHIKLYEEYTQGESPFFKKKKDIKDWLDSRRIENYKIHKDLTITVTSFDSEEDDEDYEENPVILKGLDVQRLPVRFEWVDDEFSIIECPNLISLEGVPRTIENNCFECYGNPKLETLEFTPHYIHHEIYCNDCNLQTLITDSDRVPDFEEYHGNPCSEIYDRLGFTTEAHVESLVQWFERDSTKCLDFIKRLKLKRNDFVEEMMKFSKELRLLAGEEKEELKQAYNVSKNVEGDFY